MPLSRFCKLWPLFVFFALSLGADEQGRALYFGKKPLTGKIREHETALPPEVLVCANCHASAKGRKIDRAYLQEPQQRRGGPPSAYDQTKFCKLLRTGVDPAFILIARQMPVYSVTDAQCSALWKFLITNANP